MEESGLEPGLGGLEHPAGFTEGIPKFGDKGQTVDPELGGGGELAGLEQNRAV